MIGAIEAIGIILIGVLIIISIVSVFSILINFFEKLVNRNKTEKLQKEIQKSGGNYIKPVFKPLSAEQIEDIHSRGKITPAEKVKEWEDMDLCAPGDAIGSATWRCRKFGHCCHDCLVDYANEQDEYTSMFEKMKLVKYQINDNK